MIRIKKNKHNHTRVKNETLCSQKRVPQKLEKKKTAVEKMQRGEQKINNNNKRRTESNEHSVFFFTSLLLHTRTSDSVDLPQNEAHLLD